MVLPKTSDASPQRLADQLRPQGRARRPLISLTPLIDVVFILVVFFMLASSFLDWRAIDLGADRSDGGAAGSAVAILVEVRTDGLRLSGERILIDDLVADIQALAGDNTELSVLVRPASGVALQPVIAVLDRLSSTGIANFTLVRN